MRSIGLAVAAGRHLAAGAGPALAVLLLAAAPALRAQRPLKDQDILQYLDQTIIWYRDVSAVIQSPGGSREGQFAGGLRQSSTQALRLAFDFARAQAAIPQASTPEDAGPDESRSRTLAQAEAAAEHRAEQAQLEIDQLNRQLQSASARARPGLLALRDKVTSELNFVKARRAALRTLIGFLSAPGGGLAARISELERSFPEVTSPRAKSGSEPAAGAGAPAREDFHPESAGIVGLTTEIFSVSRRMSSLKRLAQETEALRDANLILRGPLRSALQEVIRRGDAVSQLPDSADPAALTAQKKELDALLARFKQLSGSSTPLSEQSAQINASRALMLEWRSALGEDYSRAMRYLLLRLGMLVVALAFLFALSELWRHTTMRYVQDIRRRRQFLLLRRIVVGCTIALFVVLSFVTEFGSLATFAGFSAAGLAVAMQSVILSVVAYFFLVGRWGVRVGDRVTVSGVTGEVVDVGLFRLYLMELGGSDLALQPTGRIVVFPNAIFFQPSAMFKQLPGIDYTWRSVTLTLAESTDYPLAERRLLAAVESIYAEYSETVERQHRAAQSSLNLDAAVLHPRSHLRFVDSGLEITIRYPVEIRHASEIDDRITREVIREIEKDPKLRLAAGGTPKIETKAG